MSQTAGAIYENGVLRLTSLLFLKEGQRVIVKVEPVEELSPEEFERRYAELLRRMEAKGMIEHVEPPSEPKPVDFKPIQIEGEPLSETIIKMRGER